MDCLSWKSPKLSLVKTNISSKFQRRARSVTAENPTGREPDVYVTISSPDLANVLDGSLAPLQAYLTGRIQAIGKLQKFQ